MLALVLVLAWSSAHAAIFSADSPLNITSIQVLNNTTAIVISANPATLYAIEVANNSATIAYIKVYNAATATCGSGTPQARYMISASTIANLGNANGDAARCRHHDVCHDGLCGHGHGLAGCECLHR